MKNQNEVGIVEDLYDIDEAYLDDLASEETKGNFFEKSLAFYRDVKNKSIKDLSYRQKNWLNEIEGILHDRKNNESI